MINKRYPTEVLDEHYDDGTMPANVAALESLVVGHRIVSGFDIDVIETDPTTSEQ